MRSIKKYIIITFLIGIILLSGCTKKEDKTELACSIAKQKLSATNINVYMENGMCSIEQPGWTYSNVLICESKTEKVVMNIKGVSEEDFTNFKNTLPNDCRVA